MSVRVQDFKGDTIAVGTRVMYGEYAPAVVTHISVPDIDDSDERHVKYGVFVTVEFDDGSTDKLWCRGITPSQEYYEAEQYRRPAEETFEDGGDLDVQKEIVKPA